MDNILLIDIIGLLAFFIGGGAGTFLTYAVMNSEMASCEKELKNISSVINEMNRRMDERT